MELALLTDAEGDGLIDRGSNLIYCSSNLGGVFPELVGPFSDPVHDALLLLGPRDPRQRHPAWFLIHRALLDELPHNLLVVLAARQLHALLEVMGPSAVVGVVTTDGATLSARERGASLDVGVNGPSASPSHGISVGDIAAIPCAPVAVQ